MALSKLKADAYRQFGYYSWGKSFKHTITSGTFRVVVAVRLCQARGPLRLLRVPFKIFHRLACHMAGIELPSDTRIGGGLALTHGRGIVINHNARIGNNVTIFHGVTIGQRDRVSPDGTRTTEYPVIEDEVWIGPYAIIVGGITIGRGSRIAGGAFVTRDIPPYSVVVGNPAAIVKTGCTPDVDNRAPVDEE